MSCYFSATRKVHDRCEDGLLLEATRSRWKNCEEVLALVLQWQCQYQLHLHIHHKSISTEKALAGAGPLAEGPVGPGPVTCTESLLHLCLSSSLGR